MAPAPQFALSDTATFDQNMAVFASALSASDAQAGPVLSAGLADLADSKQDRHALLDSLFDALDPQRAAVAANVGGTTAPAASPAGQTRWFLEGLEVEGFRGINNEGAPLSLTFKPDCVSSISAPNGVGKSSIYDALSFAITGGIPKLDRLLQAERPQDYYLNRFHRGGIGTVKLRLSPEGGGRSVIIQVSRTAADPRLVSGPQGVNAEAILKDLDREFVLLDTQRFRSFIDDKALDRGRSFAGLLGLARYSTLRQELQALCQTRAFNTYFETSQHASRRTTLERSISTAKAAIAADYQALVKEALPTNEPAGASQVRCLAALQAISLLSEQCAARNFLEVDIEACISAIRTAEGGPGRDRLSAIIREQAQWSEANKPAPTDADLLELERAATERDDALRATSGDLLRQHYRSAERVITDQSWPSPTLCPTCDKDDGASVLDLGRAKLGQYDAVETATQRLAHEWSARGLGELVELERLSLREGEAKSLADIGPLGRAGTITAQAAREVAAHVRLLRQRATDHASALERERTQLEKDLPPSLVAVTTAVETARRLQSGWRTLSSAENEYAAEVSRAARVERLKAFLDEVSGKFADAESAVAATRLSRVEPFCQTLFERIMFVDVVPALRKPEGSEDLVIRLARFWGLEGLSAQALLSESYRNAFAVSVYLAAASLYSGAPRFIVMDDVTSSFDAGHQHHLVEVIRTEFARPEKADGPQVILLSHDTLLEKLFNKLSGSPNWSHQRLEGTARTAVLPQSGAVNKVYDATIDLLNMGRVDDAAPRVRQYLEYTLHSIIDKCRIPVPLDLAFGDDKRTPGDYLRAIEAAVDLERRAGSLVLESAQQAALQLYSAAIVGNFLAHWSTGQTGAFSAGALLGVMRSITDFQECFKFELTPGAPKRFYSSLHRR